MEPARLKLFNLYKNDIDIYIKLCNWNDVTESSDISSSSINSVSERVKDILDSEQWSDWLQKAVSSRKLNFFLRGLVLTKLLFSSNCVLVLDSLLIYIYIYKYIILYIQ